MGRDRGVQPERVVHDDQTLGKVYFALAAAGVTGQLAMDAVNEMQNAGILFRETARNLSNLGDVIRKPDART